MILWHSSILIGPHMQLHFHILFKVGWGETSLKEEWKAPRKGSEGNSQKRHGAEAYSTYIIISVSINTIPATHANISLLQGEYYFRRNVLEVNMWFQKWLQRRE